VDPVAVLFKIVPDALFFFAPGAPHANFGCIFIWQVLLPSRHVGPQPSLTPGCCGGRFPIYSDHDYVTPPFQDGAFLISDTPGPWLIIILRHAD